MGSADRALGKTGGSSGGSASSGGSGGSAARALSFADEKPKGSGGGGFGLHTITEAIAGSPVGTALNIADLGRSAVLSGLVEASDGLSALTGGHGRTKGTDKVEQHGFSWHDFIENTKHHIGFGDVLEADTATKNLPINVKRAAGFAGDVGADPLTYLTFGASTAGDAAKEGSVALGKREVARKLINLTDEQIAKLGGKEAVDTLANDVLRKGSGQLTKAAGDEIGVKTGIRFGTHHAGFVIPGTEKAAEVFGEGANAVGNAIKDRVPAKVVSGLSPVATEVLRRDANGAGRLGELEALRFKDAPSLARNVASREGDALRTTLSDIKSRYADANRDEVRNAIEGVGKKKGAAKELAALFEEGRQAIKRVTGIEIPQKADYLTHFLTPEGRDAIAKSAEDAGKRVAGGNGKAVIEHARTIQGTVEEINREMLDKFGKDGVKLFEDDPWKIADKWVEVVQSVMARKGIEKQLADSGLATIVDKSGVAAAEKAAAKADGKALKFAAKAGERQASADAKAAEAQGLRDTAGIGSGPLDFTGDPTLHPTAEALDSQAARAQAHADAAAAARDAAQKGIADIGPLDRLGNPTGADLDKLKGVQAGVDKATAELEHAKAAEADAVATHQQAAKELKADRDAVRKANQRVAAKAAGSEQALADAKQQLVRDTAAEAGAKKGLADARRARTVAEKALADAGTAAPEVATAAVKDTAEAAALREELAGIDGKIAEAKAAVAEKEKALEFGGATSTPGRAAVEAAGQELVQAEQALKDLVDRKQYLPEDIAYANKGAATEAAPVTAAVDTAPLHKAVADAGLIVQQREAKLAAATAAKEGSLSAVDVAEAPVADLRGVSPDAVAARDAAKVGVDKARAKVARAEEVLADKAAVFDTARASVLNDVAERATANRGELERLQKIADDRGGVAHQYERVAIDSRQSADRLFAAAKQEPDPILKQIAKLEASAHVDAAKAAELFKESGEWSAKVIKTDAVSLQKYHDVLLNNFVEMAGDRNMWAHPEVADAYKLLQKNMLPQDIGSILKAHDAILARWKAWRLVSPSYHLRNFMTAMFANGLAGMEGSTGSAYFKFGRVMRAFNEGGMDAVSAAAKDPEYEKAFESLIANRSRVIGEAGAGLDAKDALGVGERGGYSANPLSLDFAPVKANFKVAGQVEKMARGPLYVDAILKGMTEDEAIARVFKFHFEYDLSPFEKKFAKRAIPFYTWQRYNFPLQIEMMTRRPGLYTRYLTAKRNIELGTKEDSLVPQYFKDLLSIRTPFHVPGSKNQDGNDANVYLQPDLPFIKLADAFNVNQAISQLSPFIKTPYEINAGKQAFTGFPFAKGLKPAPKSPGWGPVLEVLQVAGGKFGLPKVERGASGQFMISDKDAYKIEQFLPLLSTSRRNVPSEKKYQDRELTTWMSFFLGTGARTLSADQQASEQRRLAAIVSARKTRLKQLAAG